MALSCSSERSLVNRWNWSGVADRNGGWARSAYDEWPLSQEGQTQYDSLDVKPHVAWVSTSQPTPRRITAGSLKPRWPLFCHQEKLDRRKPRQRQGLSASRWACCLVSTPWRSPPHKLIMPQQSRWASPDVSVGWLICRRLIIMVKANSSQGLAPHTPRRRLSRLLFLCPGSFTRRAVVFSHKKRAVLPTTPSSEHPATPSYLFWLLHQ